MFRSLELHLQFVKINREVQDIVCHNPSVFKSDKLHVDDFKFESSYLRCIMHKLGRIPQMQIFFLVLCTNLAEFRKCIILSVVLSLPKVQLTKFYTCRILPDFFWINVEGVINSSSSFKEQWFALGHLRLLA